MSFSLFSALQLKIDSITVVLMGDSANLGPLTRGMISTSSNMRIPKQTYDGILETPNLNISCFDQWKVSIENELKC